MLLLTLSLLFLLPELGIAKGTVQDIASTKKMYISQYPRPLKFFKETSTTLFPKICLLWNKSINPLELAIRCLLHPSSFSVPGQRVELLIAQIKHFKVWCNRGYFFWPLCFCTEVQELWQRQLLCTSISATAPEGRRDPPCKCHGATLQTPTKSTAEPPLPAPSYFQVP